MGYKDFRTEVSGGSPLGTNWEERVDSLRATIETGGGETIHRWTVGNV